MARKPRILLWFISLCKRIIFWSIFCCFLCVLLLRFVNPPHGFYIRSEKKELGAIKQTWTSIENFSRAMPLSVIAAEDVNFCKHYGFDFDAIKNAILEGGHRGGSTISQQVAKNVFLWQDRSWLRKGIEAVLTIFIELLWSKKRILEVYLNVAEFDAGVFGAAAGAKHYFGAKPKSISYLQAARLAAVLPNPKRLSSKHPSNKTRRKTRMIMSGARTIIADGRGNCF